MDPVSGVASVITLAALSKGIIKTCKNYAGKYRDAPRTLSRFCDELEALNILFNRFLVLQDKTQDVPFCRSSALIEALSRTSLLKGYECQLKDLEAKINQMDLSNARRRLFFPLYEYQISDGLIVVQKMKSIFESALLLDNSFYERSIHSVVQRISATLENNQNQMSIDNSRRDAELREINAILSNEFPYVRPNLSSRIALTSQVKGPRCFDTQARIAADWNVTKRIFDLSWGRISLYRKNSEKSKFYQTNQKMKQSRLSIIFLPSPIFWQTMIYLRLDWTARLESLMIPMLSLQFLDIVQDNHPIIRASIQGDVSQMEGFFSTEKASPFCGTKAGWTPLHFAAAYGRTDTCRLLISQGAPIDATGFRGINPLHVAAHFGHFKVFKLLSNAGSDPDDYHEHGMNATFEILSNEVASKSPDRAEFLKWLFIGQEQWLLDIHTKDNFQRGILHHLAYPTDWANCSTRALTIDQSEAIKFIVREGARGDELDVHDISILHEACRDDRLDLVVILLSGKCNINAMDGRGYTPLHYAVESKNFELVSTLARHGSDINAVAHDDYYENRYWGGHPTALYLSAKLDWVEMVKFLIQHGAGHCDEKNVQDAFCVAVAANSLETVQYFIRSKGSLLNFYGTISEAGDNPFMIKILYKAGALLDRENENGWSPLAWAARSGWSQAVEELVELGADLDQGSAHLTPLGFAAQEGYHDIVHTLLAAGAQADLMDDPLRTPWYLATSNGYDEIAATIACYIDAKEHSRLNDILPTDVTENEVDIVEAPLRVEHDLTSAATNGDLETVERLIEKGGTLKIKSNQLFSPLYGAIDYKQWAIAEKLIEAGAELNICLENNAGVRLDIADMPFMNAVTVGNGPFIELMIRNGANVEIKDEDGSTPLLRSLDLFWSSDNLTSNSFCNTNGIIQTLLSAGVNVNAIDNYGRTALGKAAAIGILEVVVYLVKAGADIDRPSSQNSCEPLHWSSGLVYRPPIAWAAMNGHEDVVKFLFESGAEWRSLQKGPSVTSTHRLLMHSWFPNGAEAPGNTENCTELPISSIGNDKMDDSGRSSDESSAKTALDLKNDCKYRASIDHYSLEKLYTGTINMFRYLSQRVRALYDRLELIRIEVVAFIFFSLLLLARRAFRYLSIIRFTDMRLLVVVMLAGIVLASWLN